MSHHAWLYVLSVILAGALLSVLAWPDAGRSTFQWLTFAILTTLAILAQLFKARVPGHQSYHPTVVFLFAGVLLLHPTLFVLLVVIPHLVEWTKERWVNSPRLRAWYLQPFNMAMHIVAGSAARGVYSALNSYALLTAPLSVVSMTAAALAYVFLNHFLIGLALVLARGVSWRESGVLHLENLVTDLILLCLGYIVAVLWKLHYVLILPAISPLVLMYRALRIPQLKKEAQTDAKTGLWNAHYLIKLFTNEIERAKRFERPLAVLMADLDLLRNINNTYGHLAGDTVLAGIGQIIRETTREYDISGRFGGEEFCIVLPEAGPMEARAFAERLREAIESARFEVKTSSTPIRATMSLGIACFPQDATTLMELIHEADVAVYYAKVKGRNRVVSAFEVPHSLRLQSPPLDDRLSAPYAAASVPRPESAKHGRNHPHPSAETTCRGQGETTGLDGPVLHLGSSARPSHDRIAHGFGTGGSATSVPEHLW